MFNVGVQEGAGYLLIVTSGAGTVAPLCSANRFIEEILRRTGARRVLLDMMALNLLVNEEERRQVVLSLYEGMSQLERLAILVPRAASLGMLLEAARATGVQATEFDNALDAEKWLQEA